MNGCLLLYCQKRGLDEIARDASSSEEMGYRSKDRGPGISEASVAAADLCIGDSL